MAGRPKRKITDEQIKQIGEYALNGCKTTTIATLMDIPKDTLKRHFAPLMTKKRCERKNNIRIKQNECMEDKVPSMLIFLGKNDLDQTDRQDINLGGNVVISLEREKTEPQDAAEGINSG